MRPASLTIRTYQVGFGDCFLLSFDYGRRGGSRHVLMDFGSTSLPHGAPKTRMLDVAKDIAKRCEGKLTAVVATHRHKDHISGFATRRTGTEAATSSAASNPISSSSPGPSIPILPRRRPARCRRMRRRGA